MVSVLLISFGYVIYRLPLLRARNELDLWVSREAAFLANNWILLFSAFFVLFATMFPTLSEAVTGERLTVGPPFFNKWMMPVGLALLLLTGVGPLLAWRKSTVGNLRDQFPIPVLSALVVGGGLFALGVRVWTSGLCFAFCAFVMGTITQEFWRGARVRQGVTGTDVFTALIGLTGRNKRRYGGYIVHVGIVLIFLGFAGEGFKQDEQVLLRPGQQATVGDFTIRLDAVKVTDDGQKQMITGHTTVFRDGEEIARMYPAKWFFRKHEEEPTTEVAIRRTFAEDLYLVMPAFELQDQSASMEIVVNPLVNWVWVGFGILALGTGIALLPDTVFAFAIARVPANAATASLLLLSLLLWPAAVIAQSGENVGVTERSDASPAARSGYPVYLRVPVSDGQLSDASQLRTLRHAGSEAERVSRRRQRLRRRASCVRPGVRQPGGSGRSYRHRLQPARLVPPLFGGCAGVLWHRRDRQTMVPTDRARGNWRRRSRPSAQRAPGR